MILGGRVPSCFMISLDLNDEKHLKQEMVEHVGSTSLSDRCWHDSKGSPGYLKEERARSTQNMNPITRAKAPTYRTVFSPWLIQHFLYMTCTPLFVWSDNGGWS